MTEAPVQEGRPSPARGRTAWAILLAIFLGGLLLRLPTFARPLLSDDEAIYATTADALGRGDLLYRDVVDHKPPLIYHVYQAGFAVLGPHETHGAHAAVVLAVLLTAGLLFALGRRAGPANGWRTGAAAAALFLVFSTTWHDYDALAANCELFLLLPQALAAWLLLRGLDHGRPGASAWLVHLAIGALVGISALFKYQGLTFLGVSAGMLGWTALGGRLAWWRALLLAGCQAAGALAVPALYLAWCAAAGNADAAIYWFRFNFSYVGAGLGGTTALARGLRRVALVGGSALVPYALGLWAAVSVVTDVARALRRRWRGIAQANQSHQPTALALLALLWLVTSALAVCAGGRFFGHYFHLVLPALCLLAAPIVLRLWDRGRGYRVALVVACVLPALLFFALASFARPLAAQLDEGEPDYDAVVARIAALTRPDERIFVWGNSPQLYVLARRPMGTRFSFCNYMTGESPGTPTETGHWNADANQLPAAWDMMFTDLERRRPALLVDASAAGWDGYDKFPLGRYPRLRAYVDAHYRAVESPAGVVLYQRVQ